MAPKKTEKAGVQEKKQNLTSWAEAEKSEEEKQESEQQQSQSEEQEEEQSKAVLRIERCNSWSIYRTDSNKVVSALKEVSVSSFPVLYLHLR